MDINQRVRTVLADRLCLDIDRVRDDSHIIHDLGGDSLDVIEVVIGIEDEFDVSIPDVEAEEMFTPLQFVEWLKKNTAGG